MKTRILFTIIVILFFSGVASAQFALEKVYDHSLTSTRMNASEYKYFLMDVAKSECRIYNLDHTLFKTIAIAIPADYYLHDIRFVTQNLFNSDSNIELWFSAYNWVPVGNDGYYRYISKVIDETGKELASIPNGVYAYIIRSGEEQYKMSVYAYDNSFWPGSVKTHIFSIPVTQTAVHHAVARLSDPYPNPAMEAVNLPLPAEEGWSKLQVFSIAGQLITETQLTGQPVFRLNTSGWAPGTYTYRLVGNNTVSEVKKFIVH
jgi:hypothetical protein